MSQKTVHLKHLQELVTNIPVLNAKLMFYEVLKKIEKQNVWFVIACLINFTKSGLAYGLRIIVSKVTRFNILGHLFGST